MIKHIVVYNLTTGEITGIKSLTPDSIPLNVPSDHAYVETPEMVSVAEYQIIDTGLVSPSGWVEDISTVLVDIDPPIADAKQMQWNTIRMHRDQAEFSNMTFQDNIYQTDTVSQARINGAVTASLMDANITMQWTLLDNSTVTLNATNIQALGANLVSHVDQLHTYARTLRAAIDAANTVAEVQAVIWDY